MSYPKTDLIAYVRVSLWGGQLEGIFDKAKKFYALRTVENNYIPLNQIKLRNDANALLRDDTLIGESLDDLQAHVVVEYKGVVEANQNDDYFMIFMSLDPESSDEVKTSLGGAATQNDLGFTIQKVSLGYIKYNSGAQKKYDYFKEWMLKANKELEE